MIASEEDLSQILIEISTFEFRGYEKVFSIFSSLIQLISRVLHIALIDHPLIFTDILLFTFLATIFDIFYAIFCALVSNHKMMEEEKEEKLNVCPRVGATHKIFKIFGETYKKAYKIMTNSPKDLLSSLLLIKMKIKGSFLNKLKM